MRHKSEAQLKKNTPTHQQTLTKTTKTCETRPLTNLLVFRVVFTDMAI